MTMYRVRTTMNGFQGGPGLLTHYFDAGAGSGSLADATTVAARVRSALSTGIGIWHNTIQFQVQPGVDVISEIDGGLVAAYGTTPLAVLPGTNGTATGPVEVAAGLVFETNTIVNGRRLRGRSFLSALSGLNTNVQVPPTGVVTAVNAIGVGLVGATPPLATAPLVIWSRPRGAVPGSKAVATAAVIAGKWWVLRSRRD